MAARYQTPERWAHYDQAQVLNDLVDAKAAVMSLKAAPYRRDWAEKLGQAQLEIEVASTCRIEGADFTESELSAALDLSSSEELVTRSQRPLDR